jgi:hypothetical protein
MADWRALRDYIKSTGKIAEDGSHPLKLIFDVDGSRGHGDRLECELSGGGGDLR